MTNLPPPPASAAPPPPPAKDEKKPFWKRTWVLVTGAILIILVLIGAFSSPKKTNTVKAASPGTTTSADPTRSSTSRASATTKPTPPTTKKPKTDWTAKVREAMYPDDVKTRIKSASVRSDRLIIVTTWRTGFDTVENNEANAIGVCTNVYGSVWDKDIEVDGSDGAPFAETIPMPNGNGLICRGESNISFTDRMGG